MRTGMFALVIVIFCSPCGLAEELTVLPDQLAEGPTTSMLTRYLRQQAEAAFAQRQQRYEEIETVEDARQYQQRVRNLLREQLGPLPERTPLNARTVGVADEEGYRLERIVFESQPRHYVSAILFLPASEPPYPGVVIPCGHGRNGKADQQRIAIGLARRGIAALSYDPIGQGERFQLLDESGTPRFRPVDEHTLLGSTSILVGRNTATYRIWDGMRAIDYLAGRSEIDANKIGVTGCSGGGTLTSYLMALDERVACAAPSCYLTSFPRLLATIGPQDAEQNIHAQISLGIDHADYLLLRAPRPTLILASTHDFFDIGGTWDTYRQAKRFYTRLGHAESVSLVETDARHGYPQLQREAMTRWMSRWLLGDDSHFTEPSFETHSLAEVQCTPAGQTLLLDGARSVMDLNVELAERYRPQRETLWQPGNREAALAKVREITGIRPLDALPAGNVRQAAVVQRKGYTIEKLVFEPEEGLLLPALLYRPDKPSGRRYLSLHGLGKQAAAQPGGPLEQLVREGHLVLAVDLRGSGETGPSKQTLLGANWHDVFLSYLLGRPLLAMRCEDVLIAARYLARQEGEGGIHLVAVGGAGLPALHAAALENHLFASVELRDSLDSWSAYLPQPDMPGEMANVVHGALQYYDLPDLAAVLPQPADE